MKKTLIAAFLIIFITIFIVILVYSSLWLFYTHMLPAELADNNVISNMDYTTENII